MTSCQQKIPSKKISDYLIFLMGIPILGEILLKLNADHVYVVSIACNDALKISTGRINVFQHIKISVM